MTRDDLDQFMTDKGRALVDQFMAESAGESDDVDFDAVARQNLADHEAALTGKQHEAELDVVGLLKREAAHMRQEMADVDPQAGLADLKQRLKNLKPAEGSDGNSDLRARLAAVLAKTPAKFLADADHGESTPLTLHGAGRGGHDYDGACALCRGEIDTLLDAAMPLVEDTITFLLDTERDHPMIGICRYCRVPDGMEHGTGCPEYVGLVWHYLIRAREGRDGGTWRRCTCGRSWWGDGLCPNLAETWRGPKPEGA